MMFIAKIVVKSTGQVINSYTVSNESDAIIWAKEEIFGRNRLLDYIIQREVGSVEQRLRAEQNNETKMEVEIINKQSGEIVDRYSDYEDEAIRWAKNKIWAKPYLKYKTYKMQAE